MAYLPEGTTMHTELLSPIRVWCEWETDNAGCGDSIDLTVASEDELWRKLRDRGWVRLRNGGKWYCPQCAEGVHEKDRTP